jgi:NAD(P)-dependent dehydrogenase (short-subunit alcohol dehydrogenase family)
MEFQDKIVLVTGAAQGIGKAAADAFAAEGAKVALNDVNVEALNTTVKELEQKGSQVIAVSGNTSKASDVDAFYARILSAYGGLDVLVNNAGITRDALIHKMTEDQWLQVIQVNLTGVFLCLQRAVRIMREAGRGSIVNISSDARFGNVGQANYSAAKAGIIGLTRTAARELASKNVRVNAISPGPIATEMLEVVPEKALNKLLAGIPMGRAGSVKELTNLILFLASDKASYITGQVVNCNGGWFMT